MKQQNPLPRIAQSILSAARARGTAVQDWYLSDAEYEEYMRASESLCGLPTMKICGASIHRGDRAARSPATTARLGATSSGQ